jgi:phenylpropionate dioxygenase-like ring-hydroxylating dioxygenase large terminal subunit
MKSMERATHLRLIEQLRSGQGWAAGNEPPVAIPADRYRDPARVERERAALFAATPRVIAASSSIARGACVPVDVPGAALILTRGADGAIAALTNACRHRATRLIDAACTPKALVCPYHGWTYDLRGSLIHAPHAATFGAACEGRDLRPAPVAERAGLIWLGAGVDAYLGDVATDLAALELDHAVTWRTSRTTRRCNWKLVIEAFLDGYHLRVLHRDSIYRFFLDAASVGEPVGTHIRAISGRRGLRDAPSRLDDLADLRGLATPSFVLFPATVVIVHPDFVSVLTLTPVAANVTEIDHLMLVPADRAAETEHWDRSWTLIEDGVIQREDLWACEQIQRSVDAGATDELLFGSLEQPVKWFHAAIDERLPPIT